MAQWLSWLERRPVTAEVESSSLFWVVYFQMKVNENLWDLSSAGRASALQAEGHRFEPCRSHFHKASNAGVAELADAQDLKSCGTYTPVSVRFRSPAYFKEFVGIAQLDRAFGYGPKGRGFESSNARKSLTS